MAEPLKIPWDDAFIVIRDRSSFILAARAVEKFPLLIETETEEIVQGMYPGDLILVSAPEGGEILPAIYLLELIRTHHLPLIALSKSHPAGRRLSYVISANEKITLTCDIARGTHPEQNILCTSDGFTGMTLYSDGEHLVIEHPRDGISVEHLEWNPAYTLKI